MVGRRDTDRACHRPQFESNLRHDRVSLPLVAPPLRKAEPSARVFLYAIYPAVDTSTRPVFRPTFSRLRVHPSHPAEHAVEKPGRGWSSLRKNEDPEGTESGSRVRPLFRIYTNILRRILRGYWNFGTNVSGWRKIEEEGSIEGRSRSR